MGEKKHRRNGKWRLRGCLVRAWPSEAHLLVRGHDHGWLSSTQHRQGTGATQTLLPGLFSDQALDTKSSAPSGALLHQTAPLSPISSTLLTAGSSPSATKHTQHLPTFNKGKKTPGPVSSSSCHPPSFKGHLHSHLPLQLDLSNPLQSCF